MTAERSDRSPLARMPSACGSTTCDDFPECPDCYDKVMTDVGRDVRRNAVYGWDYP